MFLDFGCYGLDFKCPIRAPVLTVDHQPMAIWRWWNMQELRASKNNRAFELCPLELCPEGHFVSRATFFLFASWPTGGEQVWGQLRILTSCIPRSRK